MRVSYDIKFDCEICFESLDFILNIFKSSVVFDVIHPLKKERKITLDIDPILFSDFKKIISKNIYEEEDEDRVIYKVAKFNHEITFVKDELIACNKCHLIPFWIFDVSNRKDLGNIMKYLNDKWPLPHIFKFLKRIDSKEDHKCRVLFYPYFENKDAAKQSLFDNLKMSLEIYICYIPFNKPITREQFQRKSLRWPCTFHPNEVIEKLLSLNCGFKEYEIKRHILLMERAIFLGKLSPHINKVGVVIFNSNTNQIVGEGFDCRNDLNCLDHATITALKKLSTNQGGNNIDKEDNHDKQILSTDLDLSYDSLNGYLCNSCDVYISAAPCLMCSMALVHSRLSNLFYCNIGIHDSDKLNDDGLSTKSSFKLFSKKSLNHHFNVYEIKM